MTVQGADEEEQEGTPDSDGLERECSALLGHGRRACLSAD